MKRRAVAERRRRCWSARLLRHSIRLWKYEHVMSFPFFTIRHRLLTHFCVGERFDRKCGFARKSGMKSSRLKSYPANTNVAAARMDAGSMRECLGYPNPTVLQ